MKENSCSKIEVIEPLRAGSSLREDFYASLLRTPRSIPPKYFYDEVGSELFDKICDVPEYYPTRTESRLLKQISPQLIESVKPDGITELGSGTARKTKHILDACEAAQCYPAYNPIDVCSEVLIACREEFEKRYQWISVNPLVGDYMTGFAGLGHLSDRNLFMFLGGTIGNLSESESLTFLSELRELMKEGDSLLIGADLVKSPDVLHAAYNDSQGVTASFNLNLLNVLNSELQGDFKKENFSHHALYNPVKTQIEMYIVCTRSQDVVFGALDECISFSKGDCILTEVSRKFTRQGLEDLIVGSGFKVRQFFESPEPEFSLIHVEPV